MTALADVQSFVRAVRRAADLPTIGSLLCDVAAEFGFDHYGLTHVERAGRGMPAIYLTDFPESWLERMRSDHLFVHDPVILASERSAAAFAWEDLPSILPRLSTRQRKYMEEARRAGLVEGFTVPLHIPGQASGVCSFATGPARPLPRNALPAAQYLSCFAFEAVRNLNMASPPIAHRTEEMPRLTQRQLDCVVLVARGKSDWVAGRLLGISPETVRTHVNQAKERFGVSSRTELVVRALYYGQLSFADVMQRG